MNKPILGKVFSEASYKVSCGTTKKKAIVKNGCAGNDHGHQTSQFHAHGIRRLVLWLCLFRFNLKAHLVRNILPPLGWGRVYLERMLSLALLSVRTGHWLAKQVHSVKRSPMFVRCTCFLYFRRSSSNRTWSLKRHLLCVLCALMISYGFASRCTLILSSFSQFLSSVCHLPWMTGHLRKLLPLNLALRVRHTTVYFELADKAKREFGKSV